MTATSLPKSPLLLSLALLACGDKGAADSGDTGDTGAVADTFTLGSPSFEDGGDLPTELKCERDGGSGESPPLTWSGAPAGTTTYALTMTYDPSEGSGDGTLNSYWLLWDIPAGTASLSQGNAEGAGAMGANKDGVDVGYTAPCSPSADVQHTYTLTLYALSGDPGLGSEDDLSVTHDVLTAAIDGLVLDAAELTVVN